MSAESLISRDRFFQGLNCLFVSHFSSHPPFRSKDGSLDALFLMEASRVQFDPYGNLN